MTLEPIRPAQTPEAQTPEAQTPEAQTPEAQTPDAQTPDAQTPTPAAPTPAAPTPAPGAELSADEQSELDLGVISTGAPDIDRALAPLEGLGERPVAEHPAVYEQVLGELSATIADHTVKPGEAGDPAAAGPTDAHELGGG